MNTQCGRIARKDEGGLNPLNRLFVKDKHFYMTVLRIGVPVVLQALISIGVNMTDTLMLGVYGEIELSASSLANEFLSIFMILCFGIGGGAGVLTAQYWGAQDIPSLKKVVSIMLWITLSIAALFTALAALIPGAIMGIYSPEAALVERGVLYLSMSAVSFPLMGLTLTLTIVLRSVRQVRIPLIATIIIFFGNVFGNWVFIYGNLGAPEMKIQGAALSTVLCRVIETCIIAGYFLFVDKKIGYRIRDLFVRVSKSQIVTYIRYSVPVIVSDFFMAFGNSAVSIVMGHIGSSFVAANSIIMQVVRVSTVFNQGVSNASGIVTGNTLGEGQVEKAYRQSWTFLSLAVLLGVVAAILILVICPLVIGLYDFSQETIDIAYQLMYAVAAIAVFQTVEGVMTKGVLRGGGDTRFLMIADVLFLWVASVPLGYLAGLVLHLPAFWIYVALKIDIVIKAIWCTFRLKSRKWMRVVSVT